MTRQIEIYEKYNNNIKTIGWYLPTSVLTYIDECR